MLETNVTRGLKIRNIVDKRSGSCKYAKLMLSVLLKLLDLNIVALRHLPECQKFSNKFATIAPENIIQRV